MPISPEMGGMVVEFSQTWTLMALGLPTPNDGTPIPSNNLPILLGFLTGARNGSGMRMGIPSQRGSL